MNARDAIELVSRMTYKPGSRIRAARSYHSFDVLEITVTNRVPSVLTGEMIDVCAIGIVDLRDLKKQSNPEGYLIKLTHETIKNLELHEIDEWFKVDGMHANHPHPELAIQIRVEI